MVPILDIIIIINHHPSGQVVNWSETIELNLGYPSKKGDNKHLTLAKWSKCT